MKNKLKWIILVALAAMLCLAAVSASAEHVNTNTPITDRLSDNSDVNRYTFAIAQDSALQFALEFDVNASYDFTFSAVGEDGSLTNYYNCTFAFSGTSVLDTVTRKTPVLRFKAGSYCVSIKKTPYTTYTGAAYYLTINAQPLVSGQAEVSPNSSARYATHIQPNVPVVGNTDARDDVDFFRVDIPQNGLFQLKVNAVDGAHYTVSLHKLVDNELSEQYSYYLDYNIVSVTGTSDQYSKRVRLGAGTYYVQLAREAFCDLTTSDYQLICQYRPEDPNAYEVQPNNTAVNAQRLQAGMTLTGNLDNKDDVDYYFFTVDDFNPCSGYTFAYPSDGGYNITLYNVVNGELNQIKSDDFATGKETVGNVIEQVTFSGLGNGTYFLKITRRSFYDASNADYQLTLDR